MSDDKTSSVGNFGWVVVGAIITLLGSIAFEEYSAWRGSEDSIELRAVELYNEYEAIGSNELEAASRFARLGSPDGREDYKVVVRHFRRIASDVFNGDVELNDLVSRYGNRLSFWAAQFTAIGNLQSPAVALLEDTDIATASLLGAALSAAVDANRQRTSNIEEAIITRSAEDMLREVHESGATTEAAEAFDESAAEEAAE